MPDLTAILDRIGKQPDHEARWLELADNLRDNWDHEGDCRSSLDARKKINVARPGGPLRVHWPLGIFSRHA